MSSGKGVRAVDGKQAGSKTSLPHCAVRVVLCLQDLAF